MKSSHMPALVRYNEASTGCCREKTVVYRHSSSSDCGCCERCGTRASKADSRAFAFNANSISSHCFVVVTSDDGRKRTLFSYGPSNESSSFQPGHLVSVQGDPQSETALNDRKVGERRQLTQWVDLTELGFEDEKVLEAGLKVDGLLGTKDNPGKTRYFLWPLGDAGYANCNSAAARFLEEAKPNSGKDIPMPNGYTPGFDHPELVGTGTDPAANPRCIRAGLDCR